MSSVKFLSRCIAAAPGNVIALVESDVNPMSQVFQSPVTALFVTLVLGAIALSGHFRIAATQCLLVATWVVAIFGLRAQPWPVLIGLGSMMAGALILLGYWFRPDVIPAYSGVLSPQATSLFSPDGPRFRQPAAHHRHCARHCRRSRRRTAGWCARYRREACGSADRTACL